MFVFAGTECLFASPVLPEAVADRIADINNASAWDEDMTMLEEIMEEKGLETLAEARSAYFQSLTYEEHGWKVIIDTGEIYREEMNEAGKQAYETILRKTLTRLKKVQTGNVKLKTVEDDDDMLIAVSYPKTRTFAESAALETILAGLNWLNLEPKADEAEEETEDCFEATYYLDERFAAIAEDVLG